MIIYAREYHGVGSLHDRPGASDNIFQQVICLPHLIWKHFVAHLQGPGCGNPDILMTKRDPKVSKKYIGKDFDTERHPDVSTSTLDCLRVEG
ncbi:hypothetical protein CDEST_04068 [Colletotrichum destructivum]|uniref:Uncharacterized protein n=1 Tax=Colletotrichum destructivum TaxID=34406 RepID=A0AAX4I6P1_9PEZI|nr:hypothetical protein CDEST_04068 [Colletotrichum destructivum]